MACADCWLAGACRVPDEEDSDAGKGVCAETQDIWVPVQQYSGVSQYKPITNSGKTAWSISYGYTAVILPLSSKSQHLYTLVYFIPGLS